MRLWSIHPKYLDTKGLVALWREGLLAKKVLENQTKGYRHHPQLNRFKKCPYPKTYINSYLHLVCDEADRRGYSFDRRKLEKRKSITKKIPLKSGQIDFEMNHLLSKLKVRSKPNYKILKTTVKPTIHPIFKKVRGGIESWEIILVP